MDQDIHNQCVSNLEAERSEATASEPTSCLPDFDQFQPIAEQMAVVAKGHGGKFVISGFGSDPATSAKLTPIIRHIPNSGDTEFIVKRIQNAVEEIASNPGMNTYTQLSLVKDHVPDGQRGKEEDVVGVFGIMIDFDKGQHIPETRHDRLPIVPHAETETSPGSFQCIYFFDRPYQPAEVRPLVEAIIRNARADATQSAEHTFRVTGTLNWPNTSKMAKRGRSATPVLAQLYDPLIGILGVGTVTLSDLKTAILKKWSDAFDKPVTDRSRDVFDWNKNLGGVLRPLSEATIEKYLSGDKGPDRSACACGLITLAIKRGYTPRQIFELFEENEHLDVVEHYVERGFEKSLRDDIKRIFKKTNSRKRSAVDAFCIDDLKEDEGGPNSGAELKWRDEYNGQFAVVRYGSKTRIALTTVDPPVFMSVDDFHNMCKADWVTETNEDGNPTRKRKSLIWFQWEGRQQYLNPGVVFEPGAKEKPGAFNLWRGFGVKPSKGDWSLMQRHIREVICNDNEEIYQWVLGWMALGVQHPDKPAGVAIALRGGQGAGKGIFARTYGAMFGRHHFLQALKSDDITGKFNVGLGNACVVFLDEAFWSGDKKAENILKGLITEPTILVEAKGLDPITVENRLRIIVASNDSWIAPVGIYDRRFAVFDVASTYKGNEEYWNALYNEIENGGAEAMLFDLLHTDLSAFNVRKIPDTLARTEQKQRSLRGSLRWLNQILSDGKIGTTTWVENGLEIDIDVAYGDYEVFSRTQGDRYPDRKALWAKALHDALGACLLKRRPRKDGDREYRFYFGSLSECRSAFGAALNTRHIEWDDPEN